LLNVYIANLFHYANSFVLLCLKDHVAGKKRQSSSFVSYPSHKLFMITIYHGS